MKSIMRIVLFAGFAAFALAGRAQVNPAPAPAHTAAPPPASANGAVAPPDVAPVAAPATPAPPVTPTAAPTVPEPSAPLPVATPTSSGDPAPTDLVPLIVIDDVGLLDAVKNLARQAGLNFQFDPRVMAMTNQPNVTIRFENVSAEDALTAVLENYGLTLQQDPRTRISSIKVKDPKAEEPLVSKVIQLKYSSPSNMVTLLKATLSTRSQVLADPRTSQIVVMTTQKELDGLDPLIEKLDTPTKQVLIEAQLWEMAKNPQSVKGIDWSGTLEAQNVSFGNGHIYDSPAFSFNQTVNPSGSSVTLPGGRTVSGTGGASDSSSLTTLPGNAGIVATTARGLFPATAFMNADGLRAVVSFLNKDSDTELVATPRAVTLDNETAKLDVSRAYPVYKITPGSANSPAGSEITWTNVGVILQVTPRISANSNISLRVTPEVSDIAAIDRQVINGETYTANIYGIRRVDTHVMIPSGATLVMGGLMNDRSFKGYTKVPILGDLPGVGLLFRKDEKKRDKNNLMIFVTPTIIEEGDFQKRQSSGFLHSQYKPEHVEEKVTAWDSGKPYDWTVPEYKPDGPKPVGYKIGHR